MNNLKTRSLSFWFSLLIFLGIIGGFGSVVNADDLYFIKQPMSGSCDYSQPYKVTFAIGGDPDWVSVQRKGEDNVWYSGVDLKDKTCAEITYRPTTGPSVYRIKAGNNRSIIYSEEITINWTGKNPYSFLTQPTGGSTTKKKGYDIEWTLGVMPDQILLSRYNKSDNRWERVAELTRLKKYNISYNNAQSDTFRLSAYYGNYRYTAYSKEFTVNWSDHIHNVTVISGIADKSQAKEGEKVCLTADASPAGMEFDKWVVTSGNVEIVDSAYEQACFWMPNENVTVKATYKEIYYELTVDFDPSMVDVKGIFSIKTSCYGDEYNFKVTPKTGHKIVSVMANGKEIKASETGSYSVEQPLGNLTISIKAEPLAKNGWVHTDSGWCYFRSSKLVTGWQKIDGSWYYFDIRGIMATGWKLVDCEWCYFEKSGKLTTGWQKIDGNWYYMGSNGYMQTGWIKSGSDWYYLRSSGIMATGWEQVGNDWYYLDSSGRMKTGWIKLGNYWYYLKSSGVMATKWLKVGNYWYYFDNGRMLADTSRKINGKTYYFDKNGHCTNP